MGGQLEAAHWQESKRTVATLLTACENADNWVRQERH
jgi:hypothetical protein